MQSEQTTAAAETTTVTTTVTTAVQSTTSAQETAAAESTTVTTTSVSAETAPAQTGDVNCDGSVDVKDAVLMARYIGNDEGAEISRQGMVNAECSGDNVLNTDDLTALLRFIARIIANF